MKALTICQPYAHLIVVRKDKPVENRDWHTNYRGVLAIHAGKSRAWLDPDDEAYYESQGEPLVFGAVLGEAELVDVLHIARIESGEYDSKYPWLRKHPHTSGPWCLVFERIRRYATPIPYRGALGLWEFTP